MERDLFGNILLTVDHPFGMPLQEFYEPNNIPLEKTATARIAYATLDETEIKLAALLEDVFYFCHNCNISLFVTDIVTVLRNAREEKDDREAALITWAEAELKCSVVFRLGP